MLIYGSIMRRRGGGCLVRRYEFILSFSVWGSDGFHVNWIHVLGSIDYMLLMFILSTIRVSRFLLNNSMPL